MAADRYEIVQALAGQGGFGRIDKATDTALGRPVAIKTLDPLFRSKPSPQDVERFHREARALAQLSHPSIPAIYDVQFEPDRTEFRIIFEWVEGQTLREHLQDRGVLSLDEARTYFTQVCSALKHAHDKGIVHRDVKPSNIILNTTASGCYLVDFGIALSRVDLSRITVGSPLGTTGYMSPEQERGDDVTPASDVFSLAIVLYESLSGVRPSVGGYRSLTLHNESFPPGVDDLVRQSLHEDPSRRPQSATEFIERFTSALRLHANFTSILADGSLREIQLALNAMAQEDFLALPAGQRVLVNTRLADLAQVDDERLRRAVASLLAELVRLSHAGSQSSYSRTVAYAFDYGFEKRYGESWWGDGPTRSALLAVARGCAVPAHQEIARGAIAMVEGEGIAGKQGWYHHDLRILLQHLLINPVCEEDLAAGIGDALQRLNGISH